MISSSVLLSWLVSLVIRLRVWQLIYRQGWHQVLPVLGRYMGFSCISVILLSPFAFWNKYPQRMQKVMCLIYRYGYYAVEVIGSLFVLAVAYELLTYTLRIRSSPLRFARVFIWLAVALVAVSGLAAAFASSCCAFEAFANMVIKVAGLIVLALLLTLLVVKRMLAAHWGISIALLVSGFSVLYTMQWTVSYAEFTYGWPSKLSQIISQVAGVLIAALWWLAVRRVPEALATS